MLLGSIARGAVSFLASAALVVVPINAASAGAPGAERPGGYGVAASIAPAAPSDAFMMRGLEAAARLPKPAGYSSGLLSKLKALIGTAVGPDTWEMASFTVRYPSEAQSVIQHAIEQDYPYFGLVAAAKAARTKGFTHAACTLPITSIDSVFATADSKVGSAGKEQTKGVIDEARKIAAAYAQAATADAKAELKKYLAEQVPYFGDIETICLFAFETSFQSEALFDAATNKTAKDIVTAYDAFARDDVVTGVATLMSLGLDAGVACDFVDQSVGGGLVGRTPLLGSLVTGACKSFAGDVIDGFKGLVYGGLDYAEKGVDYLANKAEAAACTVVALVGYGCDEDAPPPPTAASEGGKWCAPRGGVRDIITENNAPNDYNLYCNDGSECVVRPGQPPQCGEGAELRARRKELTSRVYQQGRAVMLKWRAEYVQRWGAQCPSGHVSCHAGISVFADEGMANVDKFAAQNHLYLAFGASEYMRWLGITRKNQEAVARAMVNTAKYDALPLRWTSSFTIHWSNICRDQQCRAALPGIAAAAVQQVRAAYKQGPYYKDPYEERAAPIYAAANAAAAVQASASEARFAARQKTLTKDASVEWEAWLIEQWTPKCADQLCVAEVKTLAGKAKVAMRLYQLGKPGESAGKVQMEVLKEYRPQFERAVAAANLRKLHKASGPVTTPTPTATPTPGSRRDPPWRRRTSP